LGTITKVSGIKTISGEGKLPVNKKLEFGTDGVRGKADQFPFTNDALVALGKAIAQWSFTRYYKEKPCILLGHDTRMSCKRIKKYLEKGLCSYPVSIIDAGTLPTPAILQLIQKNTPPEVDKSFDFGIVISASHNPYTDNGIKLFDAKTGKLNHKDETSIIKYFYKNHPDTTTQPSFPQGTVIQWPHAHVGYVENLLTHFPSKPLLKADPYASKSIVLDCANGATVDTAAAAFLRLTEGVCLCMEEVEPDGKNINDNCGATAPENLQKLVIKHKALLGFAFDGDGDRVIAVNKFGQIKDGDDLLALLLQHPEFQNETTVVGTVMSNHGFETHLKQNHKKLIRTNVGDKYVAAKMEQENILLGGEASGHIIIKNYLNTGDGAFVALKVLESIIINNNWEMKTFPKTPQLLINVPIAQKKNLDHPPYTTIINNHKAKLIDGRIVVRYSGTENVLRVMVEDQTQDSTQIIAKHLSQQLQKELS